MCVDKIENDTKITGVSWGELDRALRSCRRSMTDPMWFRTKKIVVQSDQIFKS